MKEKAPLFKLYIAEPACSLGVQAETNSTTCPQLHMSFLCVDSSLSLSPRTLGFLDCLFFKVSPTFTEFRTLRSLKDFWVVFGPAVSQLWPDILDGKNSLKMAAP